MAPTVPPAPPRPLAKPKSFAIAASQHGEVQVLQLQGNLDGGTAPELEARIADLVGRGQVRLVVDLSGLRYVASAGVGAFISGQHLAQTAGGTFILAQPSSAVSEVFTMLNLDQIMAIAPTLELAVAKAGGPT